jgi:ribulose 1,5-bisphosphate synthetase/thiazole synthase
LLNQILESEQSLPVRRESDLVVAGGGPAGFSAALSAARSGVSVTLIELGGALGGVWTQGLLSYILDAHGKSGILDEIVNELKNVQGYLHTPHPPNGSSYIGDSDWTYDSETMKFVL